MAIGLGSGDLLSSDDSRTARRVLDNDRLADVSLQVSRDKTSYRVRNAARSKRHNEPDELVGVVRRQSQPRGGTRCRQSSQEFEVMPSSLVDDRVHRALSPVAGTYG